MTSRNIVPQIITFIFYLLLQIFFVRQLVFFNYAFCFVYVATIILLPFDTSRVRLIFWGFVAGMLVDVFYNTIGANAAAMTLIAYLRPFVLALLVPQRGYDERQILSFKSMGATWFISYVAILIIIHHFVLFSLEASNFGLLVPILIKVIASTIFTTLVIIIIQFFRKD
jgi:rod shape-determining protein MreD